MKKIMVIDGLTTIMNEKYFVQDKIPRVLMNQIKKGYHIWIIGREQEDLSRWNNSDVVPKILQDEVVIIRDFNFDDLVTLADKETSMIVTNNKQNKSLYNLCGPVYDTKEFFEFTQFPKIDVADFIYCFGFTEEEFYEFCLKSNLIGIANNKTVHDRNHERPNGMAFWVNPIKIWERQLSEFTDFALLCIEKKRFIPKHQRTQLGVLYQGKEEEMAIYSKLPILYV
jgi:hypothetical protein